MANSNGPSNRAPKMHGNTTADGLLSGTCFSAPYRNSNPVPNRMICVVIGAMSEGSMVVWVTNTTFCLAEVEDRFSAVEVLFGVGAVAAAS